MDAFTSRKRNRLSRDLYNLPGAYFITICTANRKKLFWHERINGAIEGLPLTTLGQAAEEELSTIASGYGPHVRLEKYVVMPNHVHLLMVMESSSEYACPDIRYLVRLYKRRVSQRAGASIWQKGFYDRIVRNDSEFREIWRYIDENPIKWRLDKYFTDEEAGQGSGDEGIAPTPLE